MTPNLPIFLDIVRKALPLAEAQGGGNRGNVPPPPTVTEKIVVEIWCYLPEVILSEQGQNNLSIFVKIYEKCQFSIEILLKKSQNFLKNFLKIGLFWSKRAKFCM